MIHSRPGYSPRTKDDAVATLNADMIPAINRGKSADTTPLKQALQSRADIAHAKMKKAQDALNLAQAQAAAAKIGPEVIPNPSPSTAPVVLEPGK
jgi:hypothetical protein